MPSASREPPDAAVIARSRTTPSDFTAIFGRHFDAVYAYLARRVGRERAEDLAASTFAIAFERRHRFRPEADTARPWLLGIATNLLRNEWRAERRGFEMVMRLSRGVRTPDVHGDEGTIEQLAPLLAALDPDQRDVLLLYAWEELSYEEIAAVHCYLSGPAPTRAQALASLPAGVPARAAQVLAVPPGTVVLQSVAPNSPRPQGLTDSMAQFYVLRDHVGLFGYSITKPAAGTDASGSPDVTVQFTAKGAAAFQAMTARVAHRGDLVSGLGQTLNQHFAIGLGDQLITVPSIDYKTYPDGVSGRNGADISGGSTARTVQRAVTEMQLGALPITLELISAPSTGGY